MGGSSPQNGFDIIPKANQLQLAVRGFPESVTIFTEELQPGGHVADHNPSNRRKFSRMTQSKLQQILEIELGIVQQRVLNRAKGRFLLRVMPAAREFLLREGTDLKYGACHLKRAIGRHVVYPIANLLATDQVTPGDVISINWSESEPRLVFSKEAEEAIVSSTWPVAETMPTPALRQSDSCATVFSPAATMCNEVIC